MPDAQRSSGTCGPHLRQCPGRLVETDDGGVIDIVAYDSHPHAHAGAVGITGEMAASPVHATIDHSAVDWQITTVLHHVTGTAVHPVAAAIPRGDTTSANSATASRTVSRAGG